MSVRVKSRNRFWIIPAKVLEPFSRGEIVEASVPLSWELEIGEVVLYEIGDNRQGYAKVVSIGNQGVTAYEDQDGHDLVEVPGVLVSFRRVR